MLLNGINAKNCENTAGIYRITNTANGKVYIGSTTYVAHRFRTHRCNFKKSRHPNKEMQADFDKYGMEVFDVEVLEMADNSDKNELAWRECHHIIEAIDAGLELYNKDYTRFDLEFALDLLPEGIPLQISTMAKLWELESFQAMAVIKLLMKFEKLTKVGRGIYRKGAPKATKGMLKALAKAEALKQGQKAVHSS
ncbi:GIY-YIG nuclease family protein [Carboxylicivirga marina]|uniref:GIY-YIG nuclease family protein n=1 Tax=Carboxylicivirga marina TaxID=2800988 RepID=UPI002597491D|nr:GIY-YIG nuclease family protein [uncultured Carboxylicivirga sp.]